MVFNLASAAKTSPDEYDFDNEVDPEEQDIARLLGSAVESVTENQENIKEDGNFGVFCSVLKHAKSVKPELFTTFRDCIVSAFHAETEAAIADINEDEQAGGPPHAETLEMFAFLLYWFALAARGVKGSSEQLGPNSPVKTKPKRGRGGKTKAASRSNSKKDQDSGVETFSWADQIPSTLGTVSQIIRRLNTKRVWPQPSDRNAFVKAITEPIWIIAQEESYMKHTEVATSVKAALAYAVKYQNYQQIAEHKIFDSLQFYEHLANPIAEFLALLSKDHEEPQLTIDVLVQISKMTFAAGEKETKEDRIFSKFLIHLAKEAPSIVAGQISLVVNQLDCESYSIRLAVLTVLQTLISHIHQSHDGTPEAKRKANEDIANIIESHIMPRQLDASTYVRTRVLNLLTLFIVESDMTSTSPLHAKLTQMAVNCLDDNTSTVRKAALSLIIKLMDVHQYKLPSGEFSLDQDRWREAFHAAGKKWMQLGQDPYSVRPYGWRRLPPLDRDENDQKDMDDEQQQQPRTQNDEMEVDQPTDVEDEEDEEDDAMSVDEDGEPVPKRKPKAKKPVSKRGRLAARPSIGFVDEVAIMEAIAQNEQVDLMEVETAKLGWLLAQQALVFVTLLESTADVVLRILGSVHKTEVTEAIDFFFHGSLPQCQLQLASRGITQMIHLIWNKDTSTDPDSGPDTKSVRSKLIECYVWLDLRADDAPAGPKAIARNLVTRTFGADLAYLISYEELLRQLMVDKKIDERAVEVLWKSYTQRNIVKAQRRGAICVLSMLASGDHTILHDHLDDMLKVGLGKLGVDDLTLARYTCIALQRLNGVAKKVKGAAEDRPIRYMMDHSIFKVMSRFLLRKSRKTEWFAVAEQIINTVYALGDQPNVFCEKIIKELTARAFKMNQEAEDTQMGEPETQDQDQQDQDGENEEKEEDVPRKNDDAMDEDPPASTQSGSTQSRSKDKDDRGDAFELAQLLFVVGHVALKQMVHLELIEKELKRQREPAKVQQAPVDEIEAVVGNSEDEIADEMHRIREDALIYGNSLLACYGSMLNTVCRSPSDYKDLTLQTAAMLSLSKFLCVSSRFCQDNHHILFHRMQHSLHANIRSNVAIALGDVAVSFSTILDESSQELYRGLSDKDLVVKKNTLMVLTHLILNGMIKVKGQLGELAKCLVDPNDKIKGLAELFFKELSTKDQAIYNNLPDVISHLSGGEHAVPEDKFEKIIAHIFKYIDKAQHAENMVDKLCQRFQLTDDPRQWRDIALCLSLLPYKSEKALKKLVEGLPCYKDKLHEELVFQRIIGIITKASTTKVAGKGGDTDLQEFQLTLEKCKDQGEEDHALEQRTGKKAATKKRSKRTKGAPSSTQGQSQAPRATRRKRQQSAVPEDDEDDDGLS
ncbi:ARM repeat-containing protein [Cylindrobasidium torrendii FP15055 ss-10]|uniref:Condensin complex subunit 1 n=1 Tax=Cylindrobasidium torrendii FP15055 ss-10 TaxID=1314674 RepID=A0A0D7B4U6_9AGAR|nr:ARM repeat-containing protein [Cylindrobasidium torrendii FP15055 ss-10]